MVETPSFLMQIAEGFTDEFKRQFPTHDISPFEGKEVVIEGEKFIEIKNQFRWYKLIFFNDGILIHTEMEPLFKTPIAPLPYNQPDLVDVVCGYIAAYERQYMK